jgi:hypothetical protein
LRKIKWQPSTTSTKKVKKKKELKPSVVTQRIAFIAVFFGLESKERERVPV